MDSDRQQGVRVPQLFAIYVMFYASMAVYNTYLNLYLSDTGMSNPQIGVIVSLATAATFLANMFWGGVTDRAASKKRILQLLMAGAAAVALSFYLSTAFFYLVLAAVLFAVFFNPLTPLMDTYALEVIQNTRADYGQVRVGGTIGFSMTVLVTGWFLNDDYRHIFWLTAAGLLVCQLLLAGLPRTGQTGVTTQKISFRSLPRDPFLIAILLFSFVFALGHAFFMVFFPIHYTDLGGNSRLIGIMMFAAAITEIPFYVFAKRIVRKIGPKKLLLIAALATVVRWLLLANLTNLYGIIAVNLLHGFGYANFSYTVITYINRVIPESLRARAQSFNVIMFSMLPRFIAGYAGGTLSAVIGIDRVILVNGMLLAAAAGVFLFVKEPARGISAA